MELEELVTKIISHINETKGDIMREVDVLLKQQRSQFNTFGEGLDTFRDQMNRRFDKIEQKLDKNDSGHQNLKLIIQDLSMEQMEIKKKVNDLDQEFDIKLRRIK